MVQTSHGWVLFDSGMSRVNHDSPQVDDVYRGTRDPTQGLESTRPPLFPADPAPDRWTWGRPGDPLEAALAEVALTVDDLSLAVISHLHWDHAGGITRLAQAGVPVALHADELAFAESGAAKFSEGFDQRDWARIKEAWVELSGDVDVAPGVVVLSTPGHTPGHISLRVDLSETGTWLFPADAADLAQNFIDAQPCGSTTASTQAQAEGSLTKLMDAAADAQARIVCGHDPIVTHTAHHPPGGHR